MNSSSYGQKVFSKYRFVSCLVYTYQAICRVSPRPLGSLPREAPWAPRRRQQHPLIGSPLPPLPPDPLAAAVATPLVDEGDLGWWKTESAAGAAGAARIGESLICDQGGDPASGWWRGPSPVAPWPAADAGLGQVVFGQNLDLIWVDLLCCLPISSLLRGRAKFNGGSSLRCHRLSCCCPMAAGWVRCGRSSRVPAGGVGSACMG
jgi:hypothetical protein